MDKTRFIGRVPTLRALINNWVENRYGRKVTSVATTIERDPSYTSLIEGHLNEVEQRIRNLEAKSKGGEPSRRLVQLKNQKELLLLLHQYGKPLHATQWLAALAWEHGLNENQLRPHVRTLYNLYIQGVVKGEVLNVLGRKGENLLERVHNFIYNETRENPRVFTVHQIAEALEPQLTNPREKFLLENRIIQALGVLDLMGLTLKLPHVPSSTLRSGGGSGEFVWTHYNVKDNPITVPLWNNQFRVLLKLFQEGPKLQHELHLPQKIPGNRIAGSPEGITPHLGTLRHVVSNLLENNLIQQRKIGKTFEYRLTPYTEKLVRDTLEKNRLNPELRSALLSEPYHGLKPLEQRRFKEFETRIKILKAFKQNPQLRENLPRGRPKDLVNLQGGGLTKLARDIASETGGDFKKIFKMASRIKCELKQHKHPFRQFSRNSETLEKYINNLSKEDQEFARKYLKENRLPND
jgi:hypothetical protein